MASFLDRKPRSFSESSESFIDSDPDSEFENGINDLDEELMNENDGLYEELDNKNNDLDEEQNALAEEELSRNPLTESNRQQPPTRRVFQQKLRNCVLPQVPQSVKTNPGALFSELTDTSRIEIAKGDGTKEFVESIDKANLHPVLVRNLHDMGCVELTAIQKAVWHVMMTKYEYNLMAQAQTGSGKTLAYLVPLIDWVHKIKEILKNKSRNEPIGVVFVPTNELAVQVAEIASLLARSMFLKVTHSAGSTKGGSDLHITTLGSFKMYTTKGNKVWSRLSMKSIKFVVCDEADKYFEDSTNTENLHDLMEKIREYNPNARMFAFSATIPEEITVHLEDGKGYFDVYDKEKVPTTISHETIVLSAHKAQNALLALMKVIRREHNGTIPKTVVFANSKVQCDILAHFLTCFNIKALSLTAKWSDKTRKLVTQRFNEGSTEVLVCSDVACAGVDWDVDVVINYHLPPKAYFARRFPHRIGRTGRAGKKGMVYSFFYTGYGRSDQVQSEDLVEMLQRLNFTVSPRLYEAMEYFEEPCTPRSIIQNYCGTMDDSVENVGAGFVE